MKVGDRVRVVGKCLTQGYEGYIEESRGYGTRRGLVLVAFDESGVNEKFYFSPKSLELVSDTGPAKVESSGTPKLAILFSRFSQGLDAIRNYLVRSDDLDTISVVWANSVEEAVEVYLEVSGGELPEAVIFSESLHKIEHSKGFTVEEFK